MASSAPVCGACDHDNITKPSLVWCSECDEGLCDDCKQHHSKSKATRNHATLPIDEFHNLPSHGLEIREYCEEHNEKFQLFCEQHDCPCCKICSTDKHNGCEGLTSIDRVIQNAKSSETFQETGHLISEILDTIGKLRSNRTSNLSSVRQQRQHVQKEILEIRAKINKHLDHIQATILQELADLEDKIKQQTNEVLISFKEDENQLNYYQATMTSIKRYANNLQAFPSIKRIEKDVACKENSIQKLLNTEVMNDTTLFWEIDKDVKKLTSNKSTLGKVIVRSRPCEITASREKYKQAQIMVVSTPSTDIEHITPRLQQKINTEVMSTRGCVYLPDGRIVVSCNDNSLVKLISKDGFKVYSTRTGTCVFDITYIDHTDTIAVTSDGASTQDITLIDIRNGKVKTTIPAASWCYGIVNRNNTLFYTADGKGLRMVNLNSNSVSDIITSKMARGAYVATHRDKLYYTNSETHTVACCDLQGKSLWQFKDESILKTPEGITVDNNGNVYVVGNESTNVVVISPDGKRRRQLLSKKDGLKHPQVLHYECSTNRLLVANRRDVALLYHITRT